MLHRLRWSSYLIKLLILGAIFLCAPIALAQRVTLSLGANADALNRTYLVRSDDIGSPRPPYRSHVSASDSFGFGLATGFADVGVARLTASVELAVQVLDFHRVGAAATATWSDAFVIEPDDPALLGTEGVAVYFMDARGTIRAEKEIGFSPTQNLTRSTYTADLTLQSSTGRQSAHFQGGCTANNDEAIFGPPCSGDPPGLQSAEVRFNWGESVSISAFFDVFAGAQALGPETASATAEFSHTFRWLGFGDVRDFNGNLITDYRVTSNSGVDWSKPVAVAEPSSAWLLLAALAVMAAARLRFTP